MSFKNLEQRFKENTNKLYGAAKHKFDGGKPSKGANDDPLIVRKPADGYWNAAESRSTPITSAVNDVKRLTLFTASRRGVLFLAKQALLQTGNTFESTRVINPAFHLLNAVPFLHKRRMLKISDQKKDIVSLRRIGQLQEETYNKLAEISSIKSGLKKIPIIGQIVSAATAKRSVGDGVKPYKEARPELKKNDYFMADQISLNSKTANKYTTFFKPKYYPLANNTYNTYLNFSFAKQTWAPIGQKENQYTTLRQTNVSRTGTKRVILEKNVLVPLSREGKKDILSVRYDKSSDKTAIATNIKLDRYVDYGTLPRFKREKSEPGKVEKTPKITDNIRKNKLLGTKIYPKSLEETSLDKRIKADKYIDYGSSQRYKRPLSEPGLVEKKPAIPDTVRKNKTLGSKMYPKSAEEKYVDKEVKDHVADIAKETQKLMSYNGVKYIKYFTYGEGTVRQASQADVVSGKLNARDMALGPNKQRRKISYIRDDSNKKSASPKNPKVSKEAYSRIESKFDDAIMVSFAMGIDDHIRFRAYLKDLQQNVSPQYTPVQYIGRIEKFIYYSGVQREISFKLGLVAFSEEELQGVWRRLNYLTGMTFPYGFNKGIFQPNIIRMTIGDVYVDQPGYITSMNTNFNELAESWELTSGKQVPISAQVSMNFVLIEKASRLADSPFYGITENLDGFSKKIPTAAGNADPRTSPPTNNVPPAVNVNSLRDLFANPFTNRNTNTSINPFANRGTTPSTGSFRGFGGGGGFAGGGGGSSFP